MTKLLYPLLVAAALTPQVRENAPIPSGTAVLTGVVVTDDASGQPIRRALVTASITSDSRHSPQATTDEHGRFTLTGLPAGTARLIVNKPGFVTTYYGAAQPGSTVGRPIALVNAQKTEVTVRMPRGAVIAGTVTDPSGQPMAGVGVRLQRVAMSVTGQRVFAPVPNSGIPATDDRGEYRIFGLPAGDYVVMAQPRLPGPIFGGSEVRPTTDAEVQWAERQLRGAGAPATPGATTDSLPRAQTMGFASVYYPNTVNAASAGVVTLNAGQERRGIDLRMQFIPTARVEGTVTAFDGAPARGVQVTLIPEAEAANLEAERFMVMMEVGLVSGNVSPTSANGSFSLLGVEPGGYTVLARTAPAGRAGGPAQMGWAMTDIRVDGRDVTGLALQLAPGQSVSGRAVFEGKATVPPQIMVGLRPVSPRGLGVTMPRPIEAPERVFAVDGVIPSPYRITASATGWTLKSAVIGGRDVSDTTFDVQPGANISDAVLTFTDTPAEISGVLYDAAGRVSGDMSIVLFSTSPAHWFGGSRRVRPAVRPATDGRFSFTGLVAGEYYLAALTDVTPADLNNPQFLELVVPAAIRISVGDGEKKTQDLKIAK